MTEKAATRKAALWVGLVFLLGAALGGVLGYLFAHRPVSAANPPLSEPERRANRVAEMTKNLSLDAAASATTGWHLGALAWRNQSHSRPDRRANRSHPPKRPE